MANFSEELLLNFICDFVRIIQKYEEEQHRRNYYSYIDEEYLFRYSDKVTNLYEVYCYINDESGAENRLGIESDKGNVAEFTGDDEVVAYLSCDGELYEDLYEYEAYGAHPEVEGLMDKLLICAQKYGMYWDWADGALKFYGY